MSVTPVEEEHEAQPMSGTIAGAQWPAVSDLTSVATGAWLLRGFNRAQIHPLTADVVDGLVRCGLPGRYVLGYRDARGAFRVQHVGYAPADLHAELKDRIGKSKYFKFRLGPLMACRAFLAATSSPGR